MPELTNDDALKVTVAYMDPDVLMALLADGLDPNVSPAMQVQRMFSRLRTMDLESRDGMAHCVCTVSAMHRFEDGGGRIVFIDPPNNPAGEDRN